MHAGPRKAGFKSDVWSYRSLHAYAPKKYKTAVAYSTFVASLHEMGIVPKTPRPEPPKRQQGEAAELRRGCAGRY